MSLTHFQLDRFAEQAARDAADDLANAEYFEKRAKQLLDQAHHLRDRSKRRAVEAEQYKADANRAFAREKSEQEIAA